MKKSLIVCSAVVALSFCRLIAAEFGSAAPFANGDTVCYVGDSITHGGTYHSIVTLFYATRFPDRAIQYFNCGIGGDRAAAIMSDERYRLNVDILAHKPTAATIMLGMNDVNRALYSADKTGEDVEQQKQKALDAYRDSMRKLIESLQKAGARITLIAPSIYDDTAVLENSKGLISLGANAALGKCTDMIRQ